MSAKKWQHPELGSFQLRTEYDSTDWVGVVDLPAFSAFQYSRGSQPFRGTSRIPLVFMSLDEDFVPTKECIRLAQKIVANQESLAKKIKKAFYDDLLGIGPDSGVWWRNDADAHQFCSKVLVKKLKREKIESPEDLELLLGSPAITIWDEDEDGNGPKATVDFGAAFEDEHGVEAIIDGTKILGLGFQGESSPYRKHAR